MNPSSPPWERAQAAQSAETKLLEVDANFVSPPTEHTQNMEICNLATLRARSNPPSYRSSETGDGQGGPEGLGSGSPSISGADG
jgi:hypothetical protein